MAANDFRGLLRRRPFEPFRIHLTDGTVYEVRHPEMAMLTLSVVWLYFPAKEQPVPVAESKVVVTLRYIVRIEFPTPPSGSSN
jgi:hypothetical protein